MQWIWNQPPKKEHWNITFHIFFPNSRLWNPSDNLVVVVVVVLVDCIISIPPWSCINKRKQTNHFPFSKKRRRRTRKYKWKMNVFRFRQSLPYALHFCFYCTCMQCFCIYHPMSVEGNGLLIHPLTPNIESFTFRSIASFKR